MKPPTVNPERTVLHCNACGETDARSLLWKEGYELLRCASCGLVFVGNPPSDAERAKIYSFERGYQTELKESARAVDIHDAEAKQNLRVLNRYAEQGRRLLDVGCSTGLFLRQARGAGWQVEGLEYSADASEVARREHGLTVTTGELRPGLFPDNSFDVITFWDVIEHLPDPRSTVQMLGSLLAPGGLLLVKTPNCDGLYPRTALRYAQGLGYWGHAEPPGHLFQFSVSSLTQLLATCGLEGVGVQHGRIPIAYSFGEPKAWFRSLKWALYCAVFMPLALLGPWLRGGDDFTLVVRKARA